jgi:hypothetical protein
MFLARREAGKVLRVYPLKSVSAPCAWPFKCTNPETGFSTQAALNGDSFPGIAATGYTRAGAIQNLTLAEDAGIEGMFVFLPEATTQ